MGVLAPQTRLLCKAFKDMTLNVNNTTGSIATFTVTGAVRIVGFWGEVTTVLSSNVTAAHLRLNDQTATVDLSLAAGVALSAAPVGSIVSRSGLVTAALTLQSNAAGALLDAASAGNDAFTPFVVVKKTGATTTIDFRYTTTNAPSSGVIRWYAVYESISGDGALS